MKKIILCGVCVFGLLGSVTTQAESHFQDRAGISFRGSYWSLRGETHTVRVSSDRIFHNEVDVGGAGGWITFFSGVGERGAIEFSLGTVARVHTVEEGLFDNQTEVKAVSPILIGYQLSLFSDRNFSAFQPYASVGGGPYILSHVSVIENGFMEDEVTVKNRVRPGMYTGLGGYFILTNWLAFQGEMRYHMVNFDPGNDHSGFELGAGLSFSWRR